MISERRQSFAVHEDVLANPETPRHGATTSGLNLLDKTVHENFHEDDYAEPRVLRSRGTGRAVLSSVDGLGPNGATPRTIVRSPIHNPRELRKAPVAATEVFKEAPWRAYFASPIPASRITFQEASPAPRADVFCPERPCFAPTLENLNPEVLSNAVLHRHSTDDAEANQAMHEELSEAPDAVLTGGVYRKFLDGDAAAFFLSRPKAVQAIYGRDCGDQQHPNLAMWREHPVKTLLFPGTGQVYYILTEGQVSLSPCVKNLPSKYAWKQRGAVEALQVKKTLSKATGDGPYICYAQYECSASAKKDSEKPLYSLRVYTLHTARCPCRACHKRWCTDDVRGGLSCTCGWEKGAPIYDEDHGQYALVQVLDSEIAAMKGKKGLTPGSTPVRGGTPVRGSTPSGTPGKTPTKGVTPRKAGTSVGGGAVEGTSSKGGFALPPPPLTPLSKTPLKQKQTPVKQTPLKGTGGGGGASSSASKQWSRGGGGSNKKPPPARWATTNTHKIAAALKPKEGLGGSHNPSTPVASSKSASSPSLHRKVTSARGGCDPGGEGAGDGGRPKDVAVNLEGRFGSDACHSLGGKGHFSGEGPARVGSAAGGHGADCPWKDGVAESEVGVAESEGVVAESEGVKLDWEEKAGSQDSARCSSDAVASHMHQIIATDVIGTHVASPDTASHVDMYGVIGLDWGAGDCTMRSVGRGRESLGGGGGMSVIGEEAGGAGLGHDALVLSQASIGAGRLSLGGEDGHLPVLSQMSTTSMGAGRLSLGEEANSGLVHMELWSLSQGREDDEHGLRLDDGEEERGVIEDVRGGKRPRR